MKRVLITGANSYLGQFARAHLSKRPGGSYEEREMEEYGGKYHVMRGQVESIETCVENTNPMSLYQI